MDKIFNINLNGTTYEIQDKPLSEQVATLEGEVAGKLDASAYTPYDDSQVKADIVKKADKTYVDSELVKKQDKGNYALSGTSYTKQESDAKYLTEHQSLTGYAKTADVNTELAKKQDKGDYVSATTLNDYAKKTDIPNTSEFITSAYTYDKATIDTSLGNKADKNHGHDIDDVTYRQDSPSIYPYMGENNRIDWRYDNSIFYFATSPLDWDIFDKNASITLYFDLNKTEYIKLVPYEEVGQVMWKVTDYNYQYFESSYYYQPENPMQDFSSTEIRFTNNSGTIYYYKVENYEGKIGQVDTKTFRLSNKFVFYAKSSDVYTKAEIDNMVGNINNALNEI